MTRGSDSQLESTEITWIVLELEDELVDGDDDDHNNAVGYCRRRKLVLFFV